MEEITINKTQEICINRMNAIRADAAFQGLEEKDKYYIIQGILEMTNAIIKTLNS